MSYLVLADLEKNYGNSNVVKKINIEIEKGEFVVLLGPSGCGKTTTVRMIAGLEDVTSGDIILDGESIIGKQPKDRGVSMIFQSYAVWPHMSVFGNIAYPLGLRGMRKDEIDKTVREAATLCDIIPYLDRMPSQLSGGQKQRVAVARAIAIRPKVFLMDEPLSNLDAKLRVSMRSNLKEIHQTLNATTIFVTHDQSEAMSLADKVVIMKDGVIEQIGSANDVYHRPESIFVASFIGTPPTNFFTVRLERAGVNLVVRNTLVDYPVTDPLIRSKLESYVGGDIVMGIRPENLELNFEPLSENYLCTVTANIVEPQGSHTIVVSKSAESDLKIMTTKYHDIKVNTRLFLSIDPGKILFFDRKTEKAIK